MPANKTVLITGCSSGFGRLAAELFQARGWNVVATQRKPDQADWPDLDRFLNLPLDVTRREDIEQAVAAALERFGRIDVLVNNAGYGAFGFLEEASAEEMRRQMDVNFFGAVELIQAVLPSMRAAGAGRIINVTSVAGIAGVPMMSLYNASKFALEGLSDSLNYELSEFGIDVKTVAPGSFKTEFGNNFLPLNGNTKDELKPYSDAYLSFVRRMLASPPKPFEHGDPQEVAEKIYKVANQKHIARRNLVGKDAKLFRLLQICLPPSWLFKMIQKTAMPDYRKLLGK